MSELSDEQTAQLREYAEAMRQEFQQNIDKERKSPQTIRENIHEELDEIVPDALATIKGIIKHSKSETLRASTAKWLIDKKLERETTENDPFILLMKKMQAEVKSETERTA